MAVASGVMSVTVVASLSFTTTSKLLVMMDGSAPPPMLVLRLV